MTKTPEDFIKLGILHGTNLLSYVRYTSYKPLCKNILHLKQNCLIYVLKGQKILHFDKNEKTINKNQMLFLKSGKYIMSEILDNHYESLIFFYSDEFIHEFIKKYNISPSNTKINNFDIKVDNVLHNIILSIVPYFQANTQNEEILKLKLEEIFLNILHANVTFKKFISLFFNENINFVNLVEQNAHKFNCTKDFTKFFKLSENAFREKFRQNFHTTPKKWLNQKKLHYAKTLLKSNELNVTQVCQKVGYNDISWFIQSFKKEFGYTPKQKK